MSSLAIVAVLTVVFSSCSGGSSSSNDDASSVTTLVTPAIPTYVDPAAPITSPVGSEFSIMLPADPGSGWRWVLSPIDNTRLIALGSRFSDDPDLLQRAMSATTTTTTVARATTTRPGTAATSSTTTTTTTPPVLPLVQIISFAGRSVGPATLTFSYTQIAGAPQAENRVVTFTVTIVTPPPTTSSTSTSTTIP